MNCMNRMKRMNRAYGCAAALLLALPGCNQLEKIDDSNSGGDEGGVPAAVQLAFERSCGTAGCHSTGATAPALEGAGIADLIGAPSTGSALPLITLGDTANSYIAIKMLPDDVIAGLGVTRTGSRMPQGFDYASGNADKLADTRTILAWIGGADYPGGGGGMTETGGNETTSGEESTAGPMLEPTFANVQAEIFMKACSCHNSQAMPGNGNLSLEMATAYANLFGVKSSQLATMDLVKAGEPDKSYLFLKVNNTQIEAGGMGGVMPVGGMLTPEQLMLLEEWISAGAMDN